MTNGNIPTPPGVEPSQPIQPAEQGQPTPPSGQPIAPPAGPSGKAIATLVLGIMALICCGFFCGIPAIIVGKQELNAIKEGRSDPAGQTITQIGFILGIIGTVLSCLGAIVYALFMIFGISMGIMESVQQGS